MLPPSPLFLALPRALTASPGTGTYHDEFLSIVFPDFIRVNTTNPYDTVGVVRTQYAARGDGGTPSSTGPTTPIGVLSRIGSRPDSRPESRPDSNQSLFHIDHHYSETEWRKIASEAAFFTTRHPNPVVRDVVFGEVLVMVYLSPDLAKLSTVMILRHGETHHDSITLDARSKYFPACENLLPRYKKLSVRRALAVTLLRAYAQLGDHAKQRLIRDNSQDLVGTTIALAKPHGLPFFLQYDETIAGESASHMQLVESRTPAQVGDRMLAMGFLQTKHVNLLLLDVVYSGDDASQADNNRIVFCLGEQIERLFDPLAQYCPEPADLPYRPPTHRPAPVPVDTPSVQAILLELVEVQTTLTNRLVDFLQEFIVPLRIRILNKEIPGPSAKLRSSPAPLSISHFNTVFPPTIDEVTRVNCLLLDLLNQAMPYGASEVLRACGHIVPYFFKAHLRHEAATKRFAATAKQFMQQYHSCLERTCPNVDLTLYSVRYIDSIIHALLNLVKLKLLLQRLHGAVVGHMDPAHRRMATRYYELALLTIDAFAKERLPPYSARVFTPSGKILTELADRWPAELQYGWLLRRVVCVFDATDVASTAHTASVVVVFSDHLLVLEVNEAEFYEAAMGSDDNFSLSSLHRPLIADMLMHSFINQSQVAPMPHMHVAAWAPIGHINAVTYGDNRYVQLYAHSGGFKAWDRTATTALDVQPVTTFCGALKTFEIRSPQVCPGQYVVEMVSKAKILNKSLQFHLFKHAAHGQEIYSVAHLQEQYRAETVRLPFAMFLNMPVDRLVLKRHNLHCALQVLFVERRRLKVVCYARGTVEPVTAEVKTTELALYVTDVMAQQFPRYFSYAGAEMGQCLLGANENLMESLMEYVRGTKAEKTEKAAASSVPVPVAKPPSPKLMDAPKVVARSPVVEQTPVETPPKRHSLLARMFKRKPKPMPVLVAPPLRPRANSDPLLRPLSAQPVVRTRRSSMDSPTPTVVRPKPDLTRISSPRPMVQGAPRPPPLNTLVKLVADGTQSPMSVRGNRRTWHSNPRDFSDSPNWRPILRDNLSLRAEVIKREVGKVGRKPSTAPAVQAVIRAPAKPQRDTRGPLHPFKELSSRRVPSITPEHQFDARLASVLPTIASVLNSNSAESALDPWAGRTRLVLGRWKEEPAVLEDEDPVAVFAADVDFGGSMNLLFEVESVSTSFSTNEGESSMSSRLVLDSKGGAGGRFLDSDNSSGDGSAGDSSGASISLGNLEPVGSASLDNFESLGNTLESFQRADSSRSLSLAEYTRYRDLLVEHFSLFVGAAPAMPVPRPSVESCSTVISVGQGSRFPLRRVAGVLPVSHLLPRVEVSEEDGLPVVGYLGRVPRRGR